MAFWSNELLFGAALIFYSVVHLGLLFIWLAKFHSARIFSVLGVLFLVAVFSYNRHWNGQMDNSPFSDGAGTVDQHVYGLSPYYRVFDTPFSHFGKSYVDWAAIAFNIEFIVAALFIFCIGSAACGKMYPTRPIAEE
jgi:hypothetical protein